MPKSKLPVIVTASNAQNIKLDMRNVAAALRDPDKVKPDGMALWFQSLCAKLMQNSDTPST